MAQTTSTETFDLLVKWPSQRSLSDLDRRRTFPIANYPRRWNINRRCVWVAHNGLLVRRLHISRVAGPVAGLEVATPGYPARYGYRLHIEDVRVLNARRHLRDVPDSGWPHTFPHPAAFRYVRPRPLQVLVVGDSASALARPFSTPVENLVVESVTIESQREYVLGFEERRLVRAYQEALKRELSAWWIPIKGTTLRSDAFDAQRNLLIEAKANTARPSLRMAVGQLLDYARHLTPTPRLAVLLPEKPDNYALKYLEDCHVGTIWRTATGFAERLVN